MTFKQKEDKSNGIQNHSWFTCDFLIKNYMQPLSKPNNRYHSKP